jgi:ATP-dependent DNA helicase
MQIPVCVYHGSREDRAALRKTVMIYPEDQDSLENFSARKSTNKPAARRNSLAKNTTHVKAEPKKSFGSRRPNRRLNKQAHSSDEEEAIAANRSNSSAEASEETDDEDLSHHSEAARPSTDPKSDFPVILTTYEILMRDRVHLAKYHWGYIVVDEGHRLKNFDCRLMQEMRKLRSGSRLVLSGTPLHVSGLIICLSFHYR